MKIQMSNSQMKSKWETFHISQLDKVINMKVVLMMVLNKKEVEVKKMTVDFVHLYAAALAMDHSIWIVRMTMIKKTMKSYLKPNRRKESMDIGKKLVNTLTSFDSKQDFRKWLSQTLKKWW